MSKYQQYHPLICDPSDNVQLPQPVKHTWTSKFSRTILVGLLVAETVASAITIIILAARAPHTTCTDPQHVLYCGLNLFLAIRLTTPAKPRLWRPWNMRFRSITLDFQVKKPSSNIAPSHMSSDLSPFQIPSSPALDRMWSDLYNCMARSALSICYPNR